MIIIFHRSSYESNKDIFTIAAFPFRHSLFNSAVSQFFFFLLLQISITSDDQFLLTSAEDGCIIIWKVYDKEGRGLKREREVPYSDEVLITRTDMEEKVSITAKYWFENHYYMYFKLKSLDHHKSENQ